MAGLSKEALAKLSEEWDRQVVNGAGEGTGVKAIQSGKKDIVSAYNGDNKEGDPVIKVTIFPKP